MTFLRWNKDRTGKQVVICMELSFFMGTKIGELCSLLNNFGGVQFNPIFTRFTTQIGFAITADAI